MILAMCQQHPRQIQRQRHTQRQIQRHRQERTSKKKSSCICFAYKLHIIHRRKAEDTVYYSVMTMTTTKTHTKTNTKTKKDNDKDKVLKRPITCYIFEKLGVQGYQIRRLQ